MADWSFRVWCACRSCLVSLSQSLWGSSWGETLVCKQGHEMLWTNMLLLKISLQKHHSWYSDRNITILASLIYLMEASTCVLWSSQLSQRKRLHDQTVTKCTWLCGVVSAYVWVLVHVPLPCYLFLPWHTTLKAMSTRVHTISCITQHNEGNSIVSTVVQQNVWQKVVRPYWFYSSDSASSTSNVSSVSSSSMSESESLPAYLPHHEPAASPIGLHRELL